MKQIRVVNLARGHTRARARIPELRSFDSITGAKSNRSLSMLNSRVSRTVEATAVAKFAYRYGEWQHASKYKNYSTVFLKTIDLLKKNKMFSILFTVFSKINRLRENCEKVLIAFHLKAMHNMLIKRKTISQFLRFFPNHQSSLRELANGFLSML